MQKSFKKAICFITVVSVLLLCTTTLVLPVSAAVPKDSTKVLLNEDFQDYTSPPKTVSAKKIRFTYHSSVPGALGTEENGNQYIMAPASTAAAPSVTISPLDDDGNLTHYAMEAGKSYALSFRFQTDKVGTPDNLLGSMIQIVTFTQGSSKIESLAITRDGKLQFSGLTGSQFQTNSWHTAKFIISKSSSGDIVVSGASLVRDSDGVSYNAGADKTAAGMTKVESIRFATVKGAGDIMIDDVELYDLSTPAIPPGAAVLIDEGFETARAIPAGTAKAVTIGGYKWTYGPSSNYVSPIIYGDKTMGNVLKIGPSASDLNLNITGISLTDGQKYVLKYDFMTDAFIQNQYKDMMFLQLGTDKDLTLRYDNKTDQLISSEVVFDTDTVGKWYQFEAIITPKISGMLVDLAVKDVDGNVLGTRNYRSALKSFDNIRFATKSNGGAIYMDNLQLYTVDEIFAVKDGKIASDYGLENVIDTLSNIKNATEVYYQLNIEKYYAASEYPTIVLAAFEKTADSRKLVGIKTVDLQGETAVDGMYTLQSGESFFTTEIGKSYEIKVLVWKDMGTMQPTMGVTTIAE